MATAAVLTFECSAESTPRMKKMGITAINTHSAIAPNPMLRNGPPVQVSSSTVTLPILEVIQQSALLQSHWFLKVIQLPVPNTSVADVGEQR